MYVACLRRFLPVLSLSVFLVIAGCAGGGSTTTSTPPSSGTSSTNPKPSVTSISPSSVVAGSAAETLTITGTGFLSSSVVNFNSTALTTTYASATSLTASVPASLLVFDGSAAISVTNPAPGGGTSAVQSYSISVPTPTVSSISPASVTAGAAATVTVSGSGFEGNSKVLWNGAVHATTYVNNSTLQVALTAADTANGGTSNLSVQNPGIDPTTPVGLTILATTPTISGISPTSVTAGSAAQTVYVGGSGFEGNATLQANGQALTISSQSTSQIIATLPASLMAKTGTVSFVVSNPGSPVISSNAGLMTVNAASTAGTITVSPSLVPAGSPDTTITVTTYGGQSFYKDSAITWNGTALTTTYVGSGELTAVIPAASLAGFVNASIGVMSPESTTAPAAQPFDTYLALQTNDIVYRATDGLIYASVPGSMGAGLGNSVVAIDPTTGVIEKTIFVGSNPNRMALSTDGTELFVGLDGAGAFVQVDLTADSVGTPVTLGGGSGVYNPPYTALSFAPVPVAAGSVAVYTTAGVVTVYDAGVARANTSASSGLSTYFVSNVGAIAFGSSASTLYAMSNAVGGYLYQLTIDSTGVSAAKQIGAGTGGSTLQYDNGLLYVPEGLVYNASTGEQAGQFSTTTSSSSTTAQAAIGPIISDSSLNTAWITPTSYTSTASEIVSYNETTYDPIATLPIASLGYTPVDLIRWGTDGLALHTASQLLVFKGSIVKDNSSTPADVAVSMSAPASATTGTALSYTVTVTNNGPNAATGVVATVTLPEGVIAGTATASAGSCSGAGVYYCDLGTLASGASATMAVSATPTAAGALEASATLSSVSYDPNTSNNQANATVTATGSDYAASPVATQLVPAAVQAGSNSFTLTVDGEGFTSSSTVLWNGTALTTTYVSSGQLTASVPATSISAIGYALVSVETGAPGGGTSSVLPFSTYQLVNVPANAIAYDGFTRKLYAVLPSTSQQLTGNSIVAVDPTTGAVGTPVTVGSEPNLLSETSDGNYMYIGLSGAKSLGRFNLLTQALDLTVPLPPITEYGTSGQAAAEAIATVPGTDSSLAVEDDSFDGIGILDISGSTGTLRSKIVGGYSGDHPVFADATHFYAYDSDTTGAELYRFTIDASGVTLVDGTTLDGMGGFSGRIAYDDGLVFGGAGGIVNPSTTPPSQVAVLPLTTSYTSSTYTTTYGFTPYQVEHAAFAGALSGYQPLGMYLQRFDTRSYTLSTQLQLPLSASSLTSGTRWGQDGLAYLLPSQDSSGNPTTQILLLRGPFVLPAEAVANSAPTLSSVSASTITKGSGNQVLTVTGSGFLPGTTVTWGGAARTTTWVSSTEVTVAIPASDVATAATVTLGSANPGSEASNTLTVTVQ
ncbi:IPT/TIG domain-containing protein [Silvibacterium dinghuense]|uniref:IPT/TIG domain-containing protein n=1 Tax=Silvibacterium dinghuense TaxID=1560006 RepID=UPI00100E23A1|nr:IPT/TIG domain-containing protein [Silvibacterium dinghuense]